MITNYLAVLIRSVAFCGHPLLEASCGPRFAAPHASEIFENAALEEKRWAGEKGGEAEAGEVGGAAPKSQLEGAAGDQ